MRVTGCCGPFAELPPGIFASVCASASKGAVTAVAAMVALCAKNRRRDDKPLPAICNKTFHSKVMSRFNPENIASSVRPGPQGTAIDTG
jgi:hypothetical protein